MSFDQMRQFYKLNETLNGSFLYTSMKIGDVIFICYKDPIRKWAIQVNGLANLLPICKSDELFKIVSFELR